MNKSSGRPPLRKKIPIKPVESRELGRIDRIEAKLGATWILEALVLLAFFALQFNGVLNGGYRGQDYLIHQGWIHDAITDPLTFAWDYTRGSEVGRTNPPLYHLLAGFLGMHGPFSSTEQNIGLFNCIVSVIGVALLAWSARTYFRSVKVRFAFLLIIAFLPALCVHGLVTASDGLTAPAAGLIFLGLGKLFLGNGASDEKSGPLLISGGLICGILTKFTFAGAPFVMGILGLTAWKLRLLTWEKTRRFLLVACVVPVVFLAIVLWRYQLTLENHFQSNYVGHPMSLSGLLLLSLDDLDTLDAPPYTQQINIRTGVRECAPFPEHSGYPDPGHAYNTLLPSKYSYQALLVDGLFTDIMNFRQAGRTDKWFGPRSVMNHAKMKCAIWVGWGLYFAGMSGLIAALYESAGRLVAKKKRRDVLLLTIAAFGFVTGLPLWLGMLKAPAAFLAGYWLPRLIIPTVLSVILVLFLWLDELDIRKQGKVGMPLLLLILSQCILYYSFLWT